MTDPGWDAVDAYAMAALGGDDAILKAALDRSAAAGLPPIAVSGAQGKLLSLLAQSIGARRILEIGTLGGYSTIWLARSLPADGALISLEIDPAHADVARTNIAAAGLDSIAAVKVGPALDLLPALAGPFDFTLIDADKQNNTAYFDAAVRLSRPGGLILVDNVVREGAVLDADSTDERVQGTRRLFDALSRDARVEATIIQTVGAKKWDGFVLARVR